MLRMCGISLLRNRSQDSMIDELVKDPRQYKFEIQKCFHNTNTSPTNQVNSYIFNTVAVGRA